MNPDPFSRGSDFFELSLGDHPHLIKNYRVAVLELLVAASEVCWQVEQEGGDRATTNECRRRILQEALNCIQEGPSCG